jgi:hypothetical protein
MTKIGKWLLFALVFPLFSPLGTKANTLTAGSCSASDVQAAVNQANDGDTVLVPSGAAPASWTVVDSVVITKGITLNGQGCSVNFGTSSTGAPLHVIAGVSANFFLTGFNFKGSGPQAVLYLPTSTSPLTMPYRVYGNTFDDGSPTTQGVIISTGGNGPGLIDHNTFIAHRGADEIIHNMGCQSPTNYACWNDDITPGGPNFLFIENNTFTYNSTDGLFDGTSAVENLYGARTVFRYNTLTDMQFDAHGSSVGPCNDHGVENSTRWWEIYDNTFNVANINQSNYTALRGGSGVVFNNLFTGSNTVNGLVEFQEDCQSGTWPINTQVGRGINQNTSSPAYAWGNAAPLNVASGSSFVDIGSTLTSCSHSPCDVVNTPSQPVTLTRCESAADVAAGCPVSYTYTPYTYPHPLTGGSNQAPAPPTNLIATVNN